MKSIPADQLLIHDRSMIQRLRHIVWSLTPDASLHDDMMQEALLHLWQLELQRPAQTKSWYVQGCRFRLQHYLTTGRSLDSTKRRLQMLRFDADEDATAFFNQITSEDPDADLARVRDLIAALSVYLSGRERAVLDCLAEGLGATDIARRLRLSAPTVGKDRRKIARLLVKWDTTYQLPWGVAA